MAELGADGAAQMTFNLLTEDDGSTILRVGGELDISNIRELEAAVDPIVRTNPPPLVVDVGALRFADSSAIALWVRWATSVGRIEVREPSALLRRVIDSM